MLIIDGTAEKTKFSIKDFFSKCDKIRIFLLCSSFQSVQVYIFNDW